MRTTFVILNIVAALLVLASCNKRTVQSQAMLASLVRSDEAAFQDTANDKEEAWTKALEVREFEFPKDHAAHEDFRIEWWYYTGNLKTKDGRRFGYQLTFFRTGLHMEPNNPSRWAVRDLYTAHFAISDVKTRKHHGFQRNNRRGIGFAGANTDQYEVWNGDWKVMFDGQRHQLIARDSGNAVNLTLQPKKPLVLHGNRGLSRKGSVDGNASYYYSFTRLATQGTVVVDGKEFKVTGDSWMDHEFSTSFLEEGQLGWDWFAIQLENNVEIMLYQMRRVDGSVDPFSSGTIVDDAGKVSHLSYVDFTIEPMQTWQSQETSAEYPAKWRVELPDYGYEMTIRPTFNEQEMTTEESTGISYWEGAVAIEADANGKKINGHGYVELTGYTGKSLGSLFEK